MAKWLLVTTGEKHQRQLLTVSRMREHGDVYEPSVERLGRLYRFTKGMVR